MGDMIREQLGKNTVLHAVADDDAALPAVIDDEPTDLSEASMPVLERIVNRYHHECEEGQRTAVVAAWFAGRALQEVKDRALRRIDELGAEIVPLRAQLVNFARHQRGCRALQARHYGIGWLCAAIIWAEIGDARRFSSSDQLVRFAGMDVTVYSSDAKRSPGHLSRQGSPELRWATFEAAKCAARRGSPDYGYYHKLAVKHDGHNGKNPTLAVGRKILRRCCHTLRELGDDALSPPQPLREAA